MPIPYERRLFNVSDGLNTSKSAKAISDGELSEAVGCEYHIGSPQLYPQPGRKHVATLPGGTQTVKAIQHLQYDSSPSVLAAYGSDGVLYESSVSLTPSFNPALGSLNGTAIPQFNSYSNRWIMCNGVNQNYIREATSPVPANTGYSNNWRPLGMQPAIGKTTVTSLGAGGATSRSWTDRTSTYIDPGATSFENVNSTYLWNTPSDPDNPFNDTAAVGMIGGKDSAYVIRKRQFILECTSSGTATNNSIVALWRVGVHGMPGAISPSPRINLEYNTTGSYTSWTPFSASFPKNGSNNSGQAVVPLTGSLSGITLANIRIRCTFECTYTAATLPLADPYAYICEIFDIRIAGADGTASTITDPVFYCVAERFSDSDRVTHESPPTQVSAAFTPNGNVAATVTLPSQKNNLVTTSYVIYRSEAIPGGGYPYMWEIDEVPSTSTTYIDYFSTPLDTISQAGKNLLPMVRALFPDGSTAESILNIAPPLSNFSLVYQGSVVYFPTTTANRVYYSVPSTIGTRGAEQVPEFYYLQFQTPSNDSVTTGAICNGGRSMIVYFPSYAMLVNYLPQANDPGVFDGRVREFVSETRGAAGRFCAVSFAHPTGPTLAAAVDKMGLWVSDGVSGIKNWTDRIDWKGMFDSVDLTTAQLKNNQEMFRLELLYTDTSNTLKELHFFYGDMRSDGLPKITGPHYAGSSNGSLRGWICSHYCYADSTPARWLGWKGSGYADGKIYLERIDTSSNAYYKDDSSAYDVAGNVFYKATLGDYYVIEPGQSTIVEQGIPVFSDEASGKVFNIVNTFRREGSPSSVEVTKSFTSGSNVKIPLHRYCDRYKASIQSVSMTQSPSLIGYEIYHRSSGMSKE